MPNRYEWSEIIIVALTGGLAGGVLLAALRLGASVDNLLNFLGGAVGSGFAVTATLWLEHRRRARALKQMLDSMVIVADASLRFLTVDDALMKAMVITFQQSVEALDASKLGVVIEDPIHQYGFHSALFWLRRAVSELLSSLNRFDGGEIDGFEFADQCRASALRVAGPIEDFLSMKGLPKGPNDSLAYCKKRFGIASAQ